MPQTMTRARASAIRAVGLFAGALLLLGTGALAFSGGPDPASVKPQREVKVPPLPAPQASHRVYPDEIAAFISSAYRHDFADETPTEPVQEKATAPASGSTVRLVGVIGAGDSAMAIVGVDAEQLLLAPDESGPDFRIESIHEDRIVMIRGGKRSEVFLGERQGPLASDMRPGGLGAGGLVGAQAVDRGRQTGGRGEGEIDRGSQGYRSARRIELEQQRRAAAAARAMEASGGQDEDDSAPPATVGGNGNSFSRSAGGANGAANGPPPAQDGEAGQPSRTRMRQSGGRPGDGNGDPNN